MMKDSEIVRLKASSNKRSCEMHGCCGAHINPDDLVCFNHWVVNVDGKTEEVIKVAYVLDSTESCTIRFLQCNVVKSGKDSYMNILIIQQCTKKLLQQWNGTI